MKERISVEDLLKEYKRYVIKVSSTLTTDDYIKEELIQVANIAIWKAYINYDEVKGNLHSYLISYIRGSMLNYLTDSTRTVKPSAKVIHHINRTEGEELKTTISIDKIYEDDYSLKDILQMEEEDNSMDDQDQLVRILLNKYISQLKEKYQLILKLRYNEEKTIDEIAYEFGVSRQTVDEQLGRALSKLQKNFGVDQKRIKGYRIQKSLNKK
jgi:RNA polymerase sigma factor (sigma-70 family)